MLRHLLLILLAALAVSGCATKAGQLTASNLDPAVTFVAADLEAYVDAGIAPDGTALSEVEAFRLRGSIVTLRNALHAAMGRPLEPLPKPPPALVEAITAAPEDPGLPGGGAR